MRRTFSHKRPAVLEPTLPPAGWKKWSPQRKASVLLAIRAGTISRDQAREAYCLSEEELAIWEERFEVDGLGGLQLKNLRIGRPDKV
jgi:Protein of unknown function (DUF1153)